MTRNEEIHKHYAEIAELGDFYHSTALPRQVKAELLSQKIAKMQITHEATTYFLAMAVLAGYEVSPNNNKEANLN